MKRGECCICATPMLYLCDNQALLKAGGSAEEEVRKHRDRVTGVQKQISK